MNARTAKSPPVLLLSFAAWLFAPAQSGWALPPRQHSAAGVVEVLNCASRTIALKNADSGKPLTFIWDDNTRFFKADGQPGCCCLDSGQRIRLWYRQEGGQNVLREVSVMTARRPGDTAVK